jgi:hypothetical protein
MSGQEVNEGSACQTARNQDREYRCGNFVLEIWAKSCLAAGVGWRAAFALLKFRTCWIPGVAVTRVVTYLVPKGAEAAVLPYLSRPSAITMYRARVVPTLRQPCCSPEATHATEPGPSLLVLPEIVTSIVPSRMRIISSCT